LLRVFSLAKLWLFDYIQTISKLLVIYLLEIDPSALVKQNIGTTADKLVLVSGSSHLMIIKVVPVSAIQSVSSVVTSGELTLVVRHSEQIVKGSIWRAFSRDDELAHVEAFHWEVN